MGAQLVNPSLAALASRAGIDHRDIVNGPPADAATQQNESAEGVTIPDSPAALEELLNDQNKVFGLIKAGKFADVVARYAASKRGEVLDIKAQVDAQVQAVMNEWFKNVESEGGAPFALDAGRQLHPWAGSDEILAKAKKAGVYNARAMGAGIENVVDDLAGFFSTIWHGHGLSAELQAKRTKLSNAFSSDVPSDGGFLIPENLRASLMMAALESSLVRPRAQVIPMDSLRVPFPAVDETSRVSSVFGGIVAYWAEEGASLVQSSAKFRRIVLDAKKLTGYTVVPNELLADSIISFEAFIAEIFPQALAWYEDLAFIAGTGANEPLGVLSPNNAATIEVAKESGQPADTIVWENIVSMYPRMLPGSMGRAVWVASIDTFRELATMALSVGTGGSAIWLNNGVEGPPMTILGRPVIFTEKAPGVLGDLGDLSFVDFGFYLVGDRMAMSARSSEHIAFDTDSTAFRIISRLDGRPWLQSSITPQNNGPALSPYVQLAARD